MNKEDLQRIKEYYKKATPGPWNFGVHLKMADGCRCLSCWEDDGWQVSNPISTFAMTKKEDAEFIVQAYYELPKLIEAYEKLLEENAS